MLYCRTAVSFAGDMAHRNNEDYELAIIDWKMPNMNGIETAARIRQTVRCDLPIIMLSAYDWSEVKQEARAAGIEEFLSKPLSGRRFLLVDDNELNLEIARELLIMHGTVVEEACHERI